MYKIRKFERSQINENNLFDSAAFPLNRKARTFKECQKFWNYISSSDNYENKREKIIWALFITEHTLIYVSVCFAPVETLLLLIVWTNHLKTKSWPNNMESTLLTFLVKFNKGLVKQLQDSEASMRLNTSQWSHGQELGYRAGSNQTTNWEYVRVTS